MDEREIYSRQGFGQQSGFGQKPALLIVDFVAAFIDPDQYGGGNIADAVERTVPLLACARRGALPVVYTRVVYSEDGADAGAFCLKVPGLSSLTEDAPASQVVEGLTPEPGEYVIRKKQPSAFFGTDLAAWLIQRQVDTVIVTGCTTSGCVRASVVDSMSYNFRTVVAADGVGDRAIGPHEANLFDIRQKYADVMPTDQIMQHLDKA